MLITTISFKDYLLYVFADENEEDAWQEIEMSGVVHDHGLSVSLLKKIDPDTDYDSFIDTDGSVTLLSWTRRYMDVWSRLARVGMD